MLPVAELKDIVKSLLQGSNKHLNIFTRSDYVGTLLVHGFPDSICGQLSDSLEEDDVRTIRVDKRTFSDYCKSEHDNPSGISLLYSNGWT